MKTLTCLTLIMIALLLSGCRPTPYYEQIDVTRANIQTYVKARYTPLRLIDYKQLNVHSDASGNIKVFYLARLGDGETVKELTLAAYGEAGKTQIREATADEIKNEMTSSPSKNN